jgi:molybdenum cofactor cytidylyltransferase
MGQAKQLLALGDTTVLETTLAAVQRSAVSEVVVVLGASAETIRPRLPAQGLRIVINPAYAQGMATSLQAGLAALSPAATAALMVLADQPFVRPATLDQLIREHSRQAGSILIPAYQGTRGNPVLIPRDFFPELMQLEGDVGCRAIFARHPQAILNVEVEDEGILLDIDNQEDYRRFTAGFPPRIGG